MKIIDNPYISSTSLSGYKSIEDITIEFIPGLNIIIGKNAAGKTNFLNYFNNSINFNFSNLNNFKSKFSINRYEDTYNFTFSKNTKLLPSKNIDLSILKNLKSDFKGELKVERKNQVGAEISIKDEGESFLFKKYLEIDKIVLKSIFIKHGLPKDYSIVDTPLNLQLISNGEFSEDFFNTLENWNCKFSRQIFASLLTIDLLNSKTFFNNRLKKKESVNNFIESKKNEYKKNINSNLSFLTDFSKILSNYSPIEDLRINNNFLIEIDNENKDISIKNFFLEFLIDKKWYSFDDLSDGTKRIFFIVSEIYSIDYKKSSKDDNEFLSIIFIEEPELGVHPHQLFKLMQFLKEKSRNNQIIMTTHSPQTLDILEVNELDSIIIASKIDGKTNLKKLDDQKIEKASLYMKNDLDLSDFWVNSDLED